MDWIFDGIGTEIISIIVGLLIGACAGGTIGYRIGISKTAVKQHQKAKDESSQKQIGELIASDLSGELLNEISNSKVKQVQKGGNNVSQIQIGEIKHEE